VPPAETIERLPVRVGWNGGTQVNLLSARRNEPPEDRLVRTGVRTPSSAASDWAYAWLWRDIDAALQTAYGLA